jgi:heme-degrading monooxygenase HmoA
MQPLARTPVPPYYAVVFTSQHTGADEGYETTARRMVELAAQQPGFLGIESARGADGLGITVSYWESLESIAAWKAVGEHRAAQARGKAVWYSTYRLRVCKVEREYGFEMAAQHRGVEA